MLPGGFDVHIDLTGVHGAERVFEATTALGNPPESSPQSPILLEGLVHLLTATGLPSSPDDRVY